MTSPRRPPSLRPSAPPGPPTGDAAELPNLVDAMLESYRGDPRGHNINRRFLPSRDEIIEILQLFLQVFYPGYFGRQDLSDETMGYHVGGLLSNLREKLERQIEMSLCYGTESGGEGDGRPRGESADGGSQGDGGAAEPVDLPGCQRRAGRLAVALLQRLPAIRATLLTDAQAAFDGDPAAFNLGEIILAYPGFLAITVYRVAHELHTMGVPLMPRIMTEWAHGQTGADIHPGAIIGPSFFIDHATGAVVGETSRIGSNVKLYQGVTLGALSLPRDHGGHLIRGTKRHPTVEDGVTLYANATVLGGDTVLGRGAVVGGSVFITKSVPPGSRLALRPPALRVNQAALDDGAFDFEI